MSKIDQHADAIKALADGTRTANEIAASVGCDRSYIYQLSKKHPGKIRVKAARAEIRDALCRFPIREALEEYAAGLSDGGERARSALAMLDATGKQL